MMQARTEAPHSNRRDFRNLGQLSVYLWDYRGRVLAALALLVLGKLAVVGVPLLLKEIVNALDAESVDDALLVTALALVAAYGALRLANNALTELRDALFARVRFSAMRKLSAKVLAHLHAMSLAYHLERKTGGLSKDLSRSSLSLGSIVNLLVFNIVPTAAEFLLVAAILFAGYGLHYAAVVAVVIVSYVWFTLQFSGYRMQFRHEMNRLDSLANGRAIDSLLNYETVKYFGNERYEQQAYRAHLRDWGEAGIKSQKTMSILNFGQGAIIAIGVTLLLALAARDVASGTITIGDIVLINAMMLQLFVPLNGLGFVYRSLQYALADMDIVIRLLDRRPAIVDKPDATVLKPLEATIVFDDVRFAYLPERPVLEGIDFEIRPGEKIAVVGPSGAGKSTLARLLFRFYDVDGGAIRIGGTDVRDCTQESLRATLGVVPQDTVMFNDTIRYNIAYARIDASEDEIREAARLAHLDGFIERLPAGYETIVGERGLKLSGGEKQRVAIARVFLKNPPIIVFDEATSSLDSETEQIILTGLAEVAERATSLVIAHRLSTVVDADRILVLADGRIVERGTHGELLDADGVYARLWRMQQAEETAGIEVAAEAHALR